MKERVTLPQSLVVGMLVLAVGGATSSLKDYFGDTAAAKQHAADLRDMKAMRDREVDSLQSRIASLELTARNCKP